MVEGGVYRGYVQTKYDTNCRVLLTKARFDPFTKKEVDHETWTAPHYVGGFEVVDEL